MKTMYFKKNGNLLRATITGNNVVLEMNQSRKFETMGYISFWKMIDSEKWEVQMK